MKKLNEETAKIFMKVNPDITPNMAIKIARDFNKGLHWLDLDKKYGNLTRHIHQNDYNATRFYTRINSNYMCELRRKTKNR